MLTGIDQVCDEFRQARNDFMHGLSSLKEQVAVIAKKQQGMAPVYHESGAHTSGMWCSNAACKDPNTHTLQFCPWLHVPVQQVSEPGKQMQHPSTQHGQQQQSQMHTYQVPQIRGRTQDNMTLNSRPRHDVHGLCGKRHPPGMCWIENNVRCGKCDGFHPTGHAQCRMNDKVIPLKPPPGDYARQAQANLQGARLTEIPEPSGPSNLYYDHQKHKQTHNSPGALKTVQGVIPLSDTQSSQDVRYIDARLDSSYSTSHVLHTEAVEGAKRTRTSAMVILKSGRTTGIDAGNPPGMDPIHEDDEEDEVSEELSDDEPEFSELNDTTKDTARGVHFDQDLAHDVGFDKDEYQHVGKESPSRFQSKASKAKNPSDPYDLWEDLACARANISFGQLIQLAPSVRKQMKEGATTRRTPRSRVQANAIEKKMNGKNKEVEKEVVQDLNPGDDYDAIEIDV